MQSKPWAPIFAIERSGLQEVLIEGIMAVVVGSPGGAVSNILAVGDVEFPIWTRSILKPWQTLGNLPFLKSYSDLLPQHFAVISASHSADIDQLCLLRQLIDIGDLSEDALRCPASMPKDQRMRHKFERDGENARTLFHNCSGKHLGYLLSMKAQNIKTENYLDPSGAQHRPLLSVLSQLTGRAIASFVPTVDGCQLPNYSLTAAEAAGMYLGLLNRTMLPSAQVKDSSLIDNLSYIGGLMHDYPDLIDGQGTLDTDIMKGRFFRKGAQTKCVAKFGADGLLAVSLGQSEKYPHGAGILIKLAYGMSASHLEIVFKELMRQMHLSDDTADNTKQPHLSTKFYFNINEG